MQQPVGINILITGTPGTGKTSMSALLEQTLPNFTHIEVGAVVKEKEFFTKYDPTFNTHLIESDDEDALLEYLEPIMVNEGHHVVDYHSSELFPERWFHLVVVLKASTEVLYDRLQKRGYSSRKLEENMDAEIQCVCETEAFDSYKEDIILVRENNTLEDMEETVELIARHVEEIKAVRHIE